jgi:hypothetical protein
MPLQNRDTCKNRLARWLGDRSEPGPRHSGLQLGISTARAYGAGCHGARRLANTSLPFYLVSTVLPTDLRRRRGPLASFSLQPPGMVPAWPRTSSTLTGRIDRHWPRAALPLGGPGYESVGEVVTVVPVIVAPRIGGHVWGRAGPSQYGRPGWPMRQPRAPCRR